MIITFYGVSVLCSCTGHYFALGGDGHGVNTGMTRTHVSAVSLALSACGRWQQSKAMRVVEHIGATLKT